MAKFGQNFVQSLTNPGYSQGMFELGSTLGQAPALAKEKAAKEQRMSALGDALKSDDPAALERVGSMFLDTDPQVGTQLLSSARTLRQTSGRQQTATELSTLQQQMVEVFKGPDSPEVKKQKAAKLQQQASALVSNDPYATPEQITNAGTLAMRTEQAVFQQASAVNQEVRAEGAYQRAGKALAMSQEQLDMARGRYREWVNGADHRVALQDLERQGAEYQQATRAARAAVGQDGGKEAFNARYPNMSGIWDAVSQEKKSRDLQVVALQAAADAGEFNMSAEEVATMFNSSVEDEDVKNFMRLAKSNPKSASTIIANKVSSDLSGPAIPKATVVNMFKDQAMAYSLANSVSPGWQDYNEEEEAAAAEMAVRAAEVYQQTGSYADAIAVFPLVATELSGKKQTEDGGDSADSELEAIGKQLEELAAQRTQQLEVENPLSVD